MKNATEIIVIAVAFIGFVMMCNDPEMGGALPPQPLSAYIPNLIGLVLLLIVAIACYIDYKKHKA